MIKVLLLLFLYCALEARENPFFNADEASMPITSNQQILKAPLQRASISLPSTARTIESVSIRYKNLDGSQVTKRLQLDNSIDWHLPIFISQTYTPIKKESQHTSIKTAQKQKNFQAIYKLPFIAFYQSGKRLKVVTQAPLIRDFVLVRPHRIVFDLRENLEMRSFIKKLTHNTIFTKIRIGNHKGYYRVVVELDGYYSYTLEKHKNSYIFNLR